MLAGPVQLGPGIREVTGGQEKLQGEELACTRKQVILLSKGRVIQAGEAAGAKVPGPHAHAHPSLILIPIKVQILSWLPTADLLWGETLFFNDSKYPLPLSKASWFGQHNHVKDTSRHARCGFSLRRWNKSLLPW